MGRKDEPLRIVAERCEQKPDYTTLAEGLLPEVLAFFDDPANEAEFQAYMEACGKTA